MYNRFLWGKAWLGTTQEKRTNLLRRMVFFSLRLTRTFQVLEVVSHALDLMCDDVTQLLDGLRRRSLVTWRLWRRRRYLDDFASNFRDAVFHPVDDDVIVFCLTHCFLDVTALWRLWRDGSQLVLECWNFFPQIWTVDNVVKLFFFVIYGEAKLGRAFVPDHGPLYYICALTIAST